MLNKPSRRRRFIGAIALVAIAFAVGWGIRELLAPPPAKVQRADLVLRGGVLYVKDATQPFTGLLVEYWSPGRLRAEVAIRDGRAHGLSRGWYESGQLEVRESFVRGVSHGTRTRWYAEGVKKSEVMIRDGQLADVFREWHPNGRLARETPIESGVPHGEARSWDAQGNPTGTAMVDHGKRVSRD